MFIDGMPPNCIAQRGSRFAAPSDRSGVKQRAMLHRSIRAMLVVAMAAIGLMACDSLSGVIRSAEVPHLPNAACVVEALESIPGVTRVRHQIEEGGRPLTLHGVERPDTLHYYFYEVDGVPGSLYFVQDYLGRVDLRQGNVYLNREMPKKEFDTIYPVMRALERNLEQHCGLSDLTLAVQEYRSGIGRGCN